MSQAPGTVRPDILEGDDRSVDLVSQSLQGKRVLLVVTGGIASILSPKLARELRRHGAIVQAMMTPAAESFIGHICLEWATGRPVIRGLTGRAEQTWEYDLSLVAPATLDFIGKAAQGIADNAALTAIAACFGSSTPVLLVPTMHEHLEANPLYRRNLGLLTEMGLVQVVEPLREEGKAKMPSLESVVRQARRALSQSPLKGKRVLLTAGPTRAPIDAVRFIQNRSSGRMGCALARELDARGAEVTMVYGPAEVLPPPGVKVISVQTPEEMLFAVLEQGREHRPQVGIFSAAVLDYVPEEPKAQKLRSGGRLDVQFQSTPKIIQEVDSIDLDWFKVGFKLEALLTDEQLVERGRQLMRDGNCALVLCNHLEEVGPGRHRGAILDEEEQVFWATGRDSLVERLMERLESRWGTQST